MIDAAQYRNYMLHEEITDKNDPEYITKETFDNTLLNMKEELLEAVNNRKAKVLNIAIHIFNKI